MKRIHATILVTFEGEAAVLEDVLNSGVEDLRRRIEGAQLGLPNGIRSNSVEVTVVNQKIA